VDLRVGLDDLEKRKILPQRDSNSDTSVVKPVTSRYTDYAIPVPGIVVTLRICMREIFGSNLGRKHRFTCKVLS
jgi:hypothetical protein